MCPRQHKQRIDQRIRLDQRSIKIHAEWTHRFDGSFRNRNWIGLDWIELDWIELGQTYTSLRIAKRGPWNGPTPLAQSVPWSSCYGAGASVAQADSRAGRVSKIVTGVLALAESKDIPKIFVGSWWS